MRLKILLLFIPLISGTALAQTARRVPRPQAQTISDGMVWRISDNKDEHGHLLPPWKEIRITNIFAFKRRPVVGEKVTVVPLDVDIGPIELRITKAERNADACDERLPARWGVELEPVQQKPFFEIAPRLDRSQEYPFDACIIYPAVKFAAQVKRDRLTKSMLPAAVSLNTVKGAIDLTNDGSPDVLLVEYCCGNPKQAAKACDLTCTKTFRKVRNVWKLIDTSAPC